jgi:hypothetical protein
MAQKTSRTGEDLGAIPGTRIGCAPAWHVPRRQVEQFVRNVLASPDIRPHLDQARYRVLSVEPVEVLDKEKLSARPREWVAHVYDYTNNQALCVKANFPSATRLKVTRHRKQPLPSFEEWQEAVDLLRTHPQFGPLLALRKVIPYRPMPPLSHEEGPTGEVERTLHVGLRPGPGAGVPHQIVAVNMVQRRMATFAERAPALARATDETCGAPPGIDFQAPPRGTPGQLWISWPATDPVWRFLAIRPAASSGTRGSGIELRAVDYRGKRVLYQAHVPILNVLYDGNVCGPYRDWQWEEHSIKCDGQDLAPGFRWAASPPQTICESGSDEGDFAGVAIHDTGDELVLVTEMEAGWYRYIHEWRFHRGGTIRPRFKFGATANSCVCNPHHHHCYWRFDFDLNTSGGNRVEEYNNPPLVAGPNWTPLPFEIRRLRDYNRQRKWRVRNTGSGEMYEIVPGADDGVADEYGRGDFWVVRYRGGGEVDDGYNQTGGPGTAADIDRFVNGESVDGEDLVVWYGAHFLHDLRGVEHAGCHEVGPTLRPTQW